MLATPAGQWENNFIRENDTEYRIVAFLRLKSLYSTLFLNSRVMTLNK